MTARVSSLGLLASQGWFLFDDCYGLCCFAWLLATMILLVCDGWNRRWDMYFVGGWDNEFDVSLMLASQGGFWL